MYWKRLALLLLLCPCAFADEVGILKGGKRIIDRDPNSAADNCSGWTYGAWPLLDQSGRVGAMYVATDRITNHCRSPIGDANRFGDVIALHSRNADGTWSGPTTVLDSANFAWMSDSQFLEQHPESFVGHLASPSVVRIDGRYFMAFVGSVDDRNLCAGEHAATNGCGSCADPWSYFVSMWAVSDDGLHWRVRQRAPADAMLIGRPPDATDRTAGSLYKGVTRVSMVEVDDTFQSYFYIGAQFWSARVLKMAMFRVPYDRANEWGLGGDPQLWSWNQKRWVPCENGRIPDFLDLLNEISLLTFSAPLSAVLRTSIFGQPQYQALTAADYSPSFTWFRRSSVIRYATSQNLTDWRGELFLRSGILAFADGLSYDNSVIDPVAIEEADGTLRLFFSSADGDEQQGIPRDGVHDCAREPVFGATSPYVGTGIYEAVIERITLRPTSLSVLPTSFQIPDGGLAHYRACVNALDGSVVEGLVSVVDSGRSFAEGRLSGGCAEIDLRMHGLGMHSVTANYNTQNVWQASRSPTVVQEVSASQRKRTVRPNAR